MNYIIYPAGPDGHRVSGIEPLFLSANTGSFCSIFCYPPGYKEIDFSFFNYKGQKKTLHEGNEFVFG